MSDKAFWPSPRRPNRPRSSASPTPTCAPAAGNAIRFVEATTTYASATSSPRRFASNSRVVRPWRADAIALHAAARGSGRVGRSAAGRALDRDAVCLAVVASVRHVDTDYDALLMSGVD